VETPSGVRIAIVRFPRVSNATDFQLLTWADWIEAPPSDNYDFVILPGSKHTFSDLAWLRARGLDGWILQQHRRGATVIGVCGGFQMLGEELHDPDGVESADTSARGLGLLPATTTLERAKTTRVRTARTPDGREFDAYEIHLGTTTCRDVVSPFAFLEDGTADGVRGDRVIGTYLHGSFEDAGVCSDIFGVPVAPAATRTAEYERLADWFDRHCRTGSASLARPL
jgi:adenosylcobyric acid synthase